MDAARRRIGKSSKKATLAKFLSKCDTVFDAIGVTAPESSSLNNPLVSIPVVSQTILGIHFMFSSC